MLLIIKKLKIGGGRNFFVCFVFFLEKKSTNYTLFPNF